MNCANGFPSLVRVLNSLVFSTLLFGDGIAQFESNDTFVRSVVSMESEPPTPRGVGFALKWHQKVFLVTASANADVSNATTMLYRRNDDNSIVKKRLSDVTVSPKMDWRKLNELHLCAAEIKPEVLGIQISDLVDLWALTDGDTDTNVSTENLVFYGYPLSNIELFPAMVVPVSVVSNRLVYRLNDVEYQGELVYPSVGNCVGGAVASKLQRKTTFRGLIARELAFKDHRPGFMLLITPKEIAREMAKLR